MLENKIKNHMPKKFSNLDDVWVVGGAIREILIDEKNPVKEIDIAANINNRQEVMEMFTSAYGKGHRVNKKFETIRFHNDKINIDITYFKEGIKKDLLRRDFRLNSIAWNKKNGFFDPLSGIEDIKKKKINYCEKESIKNDPVRILRALRISLKHNFSLSESLKTQIAKNKHLIAKFPGERIRKELKKGFEINPIQFSKLMIEIEIFENLFKAWKETKKCQANSISKMNVEKHSLKTLENLEKIISCPEKYYPNWGKYFKKLNKPQWWMYLGVLLHDIGKPKTICINEKKITYPRHAQIGFDLVEKDIENLKLSKEEKNGIQAIISNHLRVSQLANNNELPTKRAINKFFRNLKELSIFFIFLDLADASAYPKKVTEQILTKNHLKIHDFLLDSFFLKKEKILPEPLLNGKDLIQIGYKEGPLIGKTLKKITNLQISEKIKNTEEALKYASEELNTK